jgi:hypothetical protein
MHKEHQSEMIKSRTCPIHVLQSPLTGCRARIVCLRGKRQRRARGSQHSDHWLDYLTLLCIHQPQPRDLSEFDRWLNAAWSQDHNLEFYSNLNQLVNKRIMREPMCVT